MKPARRKLLKAQEKAFKVALARHNLEACGYGTGNPPPTDHLLWNQYQLVKSYDKKARKLARKNEVWVCDTSKMDMALDSPREYGGDVRWSRTCD